MGSEAAAWRETVRAVWQRRLAVVMVAIVGLLAGLAFALGQTPRWTASAQVVLAPVAPPAVLAGTPIDTSSGQNTGGTLGLDLPADTQARAMSAPDLLLSVARKLNISTDAASMTAFQHATRVQAVTDNLYTITTDGPSARASADRANAIGDAYLAQRVDAAKTILSKAEAQARSVSAALYDQANHTKDSGRQQTLRSSAQQQTQVADAYRNAMSLVGTNSSIVAPANASDAVRSPKTLRDAAFGLVIGLVLAVIAVLSVYHLSPRARTRDEVANSAGVRVLASKARPRGRRPDPDQELIGLGVAALAALNGQRPQWRRLLVIGVAPDSDVAPLAFAVASGNADQGRPSIAVATVPGTDHPEALVPSTTSAATSASSAMNGLERRIMDRRTDDRRNVVRDDEPDDGEPAARRPANVAAAGVMVRPNAKPATAGSSGQGEPDEPGVDGAADRLQAQPETGHASLGRPTEDGGVTDLVALPTAQRGSAARRYLRGIQGTSPELSELPAGHSDVPAVRAAAALGPVLRSFYQQVVVAGPVDDAASSLLTGQCDVVLLVAQAGHDTRASIAAAAERVVLAGGDLVGVVVTDTRADDHSVGVPVVQAAVDPLLDAEPLA